MAIITVPKPLRDKLGEDGSEALVNLINQQTDFVKGDVIKIAEEKFEQRLVEETGKLDKRIVDETSKLDNRITEEVSKLEGQITELDKRLTKEVSRLDVSISQVQSNLVRWMFVFWIGQFGMTMGLLFAFFR